MTNTLCPTCGQELPTEVDSFGTRVQAARVEQEMTRQDLADSLGYERTSIVTRWETGQLEPTEIAIVESVAMALRVTPAWLLYGVVEPQLFVEPGMPSEPPAEHVEEFEEWPDDLTDDELDAATESTRPAILNRIANEDA